MILRAEESSLARFYDLLDGFEEGDPTERLADDLQFEMMFPAADGIPAERFNGDKGGFEEFREEVRARGPRFRHSETQRRHNIDTLVEADGLELMVGRAVGGRRNGTLLAVAQGDEHGKLRRYALVMSAAVQFSERALRADPPPDLVAKYFDRVDGISLEEPLDQLSEDFEFEMVFPGFNGAPDERISRDKDDFRRFREQIKARRPRRRVTTQEERRHHLRTSIVADGLVLAVAEARNGRRNGTLIVAAEADRHGRMRRYLVAMAPAVQLSDQ